MFEKLFLELLKEQDVVVVSGLGAFVVENAPAQPSPDGESILPPRKTLIFNDSIKTSDGSVEFAIANREKVSIDVAKQRVEMLVFDVKTALREQSKYVFQGIGTLSINDDYKLSLLVDEKSEFAENNSFLPRVDVTTDAEINKVSAEKKNEPKAELKSEKQKKEVPTKADKKTPKSKKKQPEKVESTSGTSKGLILIVVLLSFTMGIGLFAFFAPSVTYNLLSKSGIPGLAEIFKPDTTITTHVDTVIVEPGATDSVENHSESITSEETTTQTTETVAEAPIEPTPAPEPVVQPTPTRPKHTIVESGDLFAQESNPNKYYIIVGGFKEEANARKRSDELTGKGFVVKIIRPTGSSSLYRVSIGGAFESFKDAKPKMAEFQSQFTEALWVLKY